MLTIKEIWKWDRRNIANITLSSGVFILGYCLGAVWQGAYHWLWWIIGVAYFVPGVLMYRVVLREHDVMVARLRHKANKQSRGKSMVIGIEEDN